MKEEKVLKILINAFDCNQNCKFYANDIVEQTIGWKNNNRLNLSDDEIEFLSNEDNREDILGIMRTLKTVGVLDEPSPISSPRDYTINRYEAVEYNNFWNILGRKVKKYKIPLMIVSFVIGYISDLGKSYIIEYLK